MNKPHGELSVFERFTLHRKRSDGHRWRAAADEPPLTSDRRRSAANGSR